MIKIKKMIKMTMRFISLLMALAMLAALPAGSLADTQELFPEEEPGAHMGDYKDEKGEVKLTRDVPRSVDEDFSFTRVLLGTNSASSLTVGLYGAYYIENNMRSMVGNADSPYTLGISVSGNKVRLPRRQHAHHGGKRYDQPCKPERERRLSDDRRLHRRLCGRQELSWQSSHQRRQRRKALRYQCHSHGSLSLRFGTI